AVSFGGNDRPTAEMPIDWGPEIPLTFMCASKVVVVSPARDRPIEEHLRLGEAIAALPGRVALIASADHGHTHRADGIYGYHAAAAEYDALLAAIVASDTLGFLQLAGPSEPGAAGLLRQLA